MTTNTTSLNILLTGLSNINADLCDQLRATFARQAAALADDSPEFADLVNDLCNTLRGLLHAETHADVRYASVIRVEGR